MALALPASARADAPEPVELDPATDTVRVAGRLDGDTLTEPASGAAATIGLQYVREHRAALGLTAADLDTLGAPTVETFSGIRQVRWPQEVDGIAVADAELRVNVTDDGRVLSVLGSPSSDLPTDTTPRLAKPEPDAELTIYDDRLAYRYEDEVSAEAIYDVITDADTGRVLRKTNLVKSATVRVWDNHPSFDVAAKLVDLGAPWLTSATTLDGQFIHAYTDLDDSNTATASEEVVPGVYGFTDHCSNAATPCAWNGSTVFPNASRTANREQNAVQAFYLANRFRDHLAAPPINFEGFTDKLLLEASDTAGLPTFPDPVTAPRFTTSNANMYTPPRGKSPRMQMYLWRSPFRNVNSGDDASIVYHEYAHGLTGRLVTFPDGVGALSSWQAGAMGEGWSDFFAKDFLVSEGLETDDPATPGEIDMGAYTDAAPKTLRHGALDCPVDVIHGKCPTGGGYTYGDFAKIYGNSPEYHADGEIWAQTLWDLRRALPAGEALRLITAALRLSPPEPSFLDMRNAILLADAPTGAFHDQIWSVFARRGMGFYASTTGGGDVAPVEDDSAPPVAGAPVGTLSGTITDVDGKPQPGITVSVGGLESGPDALRATTNAAGVYEIDDVPVRTYKSIVVGAAGYDQVVLEDVAVPGVANATVRRNWAVGAALQSTAGSENADGGCGPKQAVDGLRGSTWSTWQPGGDKELVIKLPQAVDITGFGVDPTAGCADEEDSSTARFQIAVGPSATGPWTVVVDSTLGAEHLRRTTVFPAAVDNATFVRMLPMSTQTPNEDYIDLSEFAVYGASSAGDTRLTSTPPAVTRNRTATFTFDGGTSYTCAWDGVPVPSCTSPQTRSDLAEGPHSFTVTASNAVGPDPTPATYAWTIDTTEPVTTISSAAVNERTATFTFGATDATALTYTCTLDGSTAPCTSPARYAGLADGPHAFKVTATDAAGNSAAASRPVTVDATPPETTITWAPPPILTTRDFSFAFSASKAGTFMCSVDGATAQPCTSPFTLTGLAEGAHSLEVTAIDIAGRPDPTPARSDFLVVVPGLPPAPQPTPTPAASATPAPKVVALTSASAAKTVSRKTGRLTVKLRGTKGAKVVLQAKLGSRVVGRATKTLRGSSLSVRLVLDRKRLKAGATVTVTVKGSGSGLVSAARTLRIRIKG